VTDSPTLPIIPDTIPLARGIIAPSPDALPSAADYLRPTLESALAEPLLDGPYVGEVGLELVDPRGMAFRARAGTGYELIMDTSPEHGGASSGFEPLELLALAVGGCTALDAIAILRKKRQIVTGYRLRVATRQVQEHPRVYSHFVVLHIVQGRAIDPRAVARSIELSALKYCPVGAMLASGTQITHQFRIVPEP
jgi:putative redox protein